MIREQLERILASEVFIRSNRIRRFLTYIVQESLAGRADQLSEYSIGVSVFDRGTDFEPMVDPIVRNDARRLRYKLLEYYRQPSAKSDEIVIEVPKGGYAPAFVPRAQRAEPTGRKRLAVVPFELLSDAAASHAACRAVALSVTAGLTGLHDVETIPYGTEPVGASHRLEGTFLEFGRQCRVIVNLIDSANTRQMWAQEFDFESPSAAAFQTEVTRVVVREVASRLEGSRPMPFVVGKAA